MVRQTKMSLTQFQRQEEKIDDLIRSYKNFFNRMTQQKWRGKVTKNIKERLFMDQCSPLTTYIFTRVINAFLGEPEDEHYLYKKTSFSKYGRLVMIYMNLANLNNLTPFLLFWFEYLHQYPEVNKIFLLLETPLNQDKKEITLKTLFDSSKKYTMNTDQIYPCFIEIHRKSHYTNITPFELVYNLKSEGFFKKTLSYLEIVSNFVYDCYKKNFQNTKINLLKPIHLKLVKAPKPVCPQLVLFLMIALSKGYPKQQLKGLLTKKFQIVSPSSTSSKKQQQPIIMKGEISQIERDLDRIPKSLKMYTQDNKFEIRSLLLILYEKYGFSQGFVDLVSFLHKCGLTSYEKLEEWNSRWKVFEMMIYDKIPKESISQKDKFIELDSVLEDYLFYRDHTYIFPNKEQQIISLDASNRLKDLVRQNPQLKNTNMVLSLWTCFLEMFRICLNKINHKILCNWILKSKSFYQMFHTMLSFILEDPENRMTQKLFLSLGNFHMMRSTFFS